MGNGTRSGAAAAQHRKKVSPLPITMVPTWTGKTGEQFPVREKSGNFAKIGKVREFYSK